nr:unnamed protein product [Fusarium pseudograminearum CS3487]
MESVESGPERFWRESQRLETNLCTQPGGEMTRPAEHAPAIAEWIMYCSSGGDGYSGRQKPDVPGRASRSRTGLEERTVSDGTGI